MDMKNEDMAYLVIFSNCKTKHRGESYNVSEIKYYYFHDNVQYQVRKDIFSARGLRAKTVNRQILILPPPP